ncbi:endonuclease [uncultured Legionella sp.]|uniref:endonuclease n=1 Tax=uncultured Legionella sp. TaxID=210934 RepID=UPI00262E7F27|nr:endonuclease [uncultured Legionella sp.]
MFRFFISFFLFCLTNAGGASPANFSQAKKIAGEVFAQHPMTIYCGCAFRGKHIDLASCGMSDALMKKRAHQLEWEHIVAAEHFGQQFECWRKPLCSKNGKPYKGRACCQKIEPRFKEMEAELYNLWPEVGVINQARSNYRFGMVSSSEQQFGCNIKIDKKNRRVEPSDTAKGIVARAYLFMEQRYHLKLSDSQKRIFIVWHQQFPPSEWEITWAQEVAQIEGYKNAYILG